MTHPAILNALFEFCVSYFHENDQIPPNSIVEERLGYNSRTTATRRLNLLVKDGRLKYNDNGKLMFSDRSIPRRQQA